MNFGELVAQLNYLAVITAAFSAFVVGGIWYGPLFGKAWQVENKLSDDDLKKGGPLLTYSVSFLLALVSAFNLALFIGTTADWIFGLFAGVMTGLFFVSTFIGIIYLFEKKSLKLFLMNAGYVSLSFMVMGTILGAWR